MSKSKEPNLEWFAYKTNGGTVHLEGLGNHTEFPDWEQEVLETLRDVCADRDNSIHGCEMMKLFLVNGYPISGKSLEQVGRDLKLGFAVAFDEAAQRPRRKGMGPRDKRQVAK